MSQRTYLANAAGEKQKATVVVANTWATNDLATLEIDNVSFTLTVGSLVTTAQVATSLQEMLDAGADEALTDTTALYAPTTGPQNAGQFKELTSSVASSTVTVLGPTGVPFTISGSESTAGSGTITVTSALRAATGKWHFDNQDNWSGNTVPVDNDEIVFESGESGPLYALTPAIQPAKVTKLMAFTGQIGLPNINKSNQGLPYSEYRTKALTFDDNSVTCTYELEVGEGRGSSLCRIAAGAGQSIFNVYGKPQRTDNAVPPTLLTGTHASNVLNNFGGDVGFGFYPDETGTLATLNHGNGPQTSAVTYCGVGVTLTSATISVNGGTLTTNSALSTSAGGVTIHAGKHYHYAGNVGDLTIEKGGEFILRAGTNITFAGTVKLMGGKLNLGDYQRVATFSNAVELYKDYEFNDPNGTANTNTDFTPVGCTLDDGKLRLGPDRTLRKTA